MVAPVLAITCASLLAAGLQPALEAGLRSEARARSAPEGEVRSGVDLDLDGRLALGLQSTALGLGVAYTPQLLVSRTSPGTSAHVLHGAQLFADWRPDVRWHLRAEQRAEVGTVDLGQLARPFEGPGPDVLAPLPEARTVRTATFESSLSLQHELSRRLQAVAVGALAVGGGLGEAGRAALPSQVSPRLRAGLQYAVTRRSVLGSELNAAYASFSGGRRALSLEASERWQYHLSRRTSARLGLGAGLVHEEPAADAPGQRATTSLVPIAEGSLNRRHEVDGQALDGQLSARLSPFIDRLAGTAYLRLELGAHARWHLAEGWQLGGRASTALSDDSRSGPLAVLEADLGHEVARGVGLSVGVRGGWQGRPRSDEVAPLGTGTRLEAFLAATFAQRSPL